MGTRVEFFGGLLSGFCGLRGLVINPFFSFVYLSGAIPSEASRYRSVLDVATKQHVAIVGCKAVVSIRSVRPCLCIYLIAVQFNPQTSFQH